MRLQNIDANLLRSLRALLEERHVTRAGIRVGLGQPAMSDALARLRRIFEDELLVRVGGKYELTPGGMALLDRVAVAVDAIDRLMAVDPNTDQRNMDREFRIWATDISLVLAKPLLRLLAEKSPNTRICFLDINLGAEEPEFALRTADGVLAPRGFIGDLPSLPVFTDNWCFIASREHAPPGLMFTVDELARRPWVATYRTQQAMSPPRRELSILGRDLNIVSVVEGFMSLPSLVSGSSRLAFMPRRMAELGSHPDLAVLDCPFHVPPLIETFWWHKARQDDREHKWLREMITAAAAELAEPVPVTAEQSMPPREVTQQR